MRRLNFFRMRDADDHDDDDDDGDA